MFFQINVTPKEKKPQEPAERSVVENNNYSMILAPFQPPTRIKLETQVNVTAQCSVTLGNTNNRLLTITVIKTPPLQERWMALNSMEWVIPAGNSAVLEIIWNPRESGSWRDVIQLMDNRRIKYDLPLILNCLNDSKTSNGITKHKGRTLLRSKTTNNELRRNGKSSLDRNERKIKETISKTHVMQTSHTKRSRSLVRESTNKENVSNNIDHNWFLNHVKSKRLKREDNASAQSSQPSSQFHNFTTLVNSNTFTLTPLDPNKYQQKNIVAECKQSAVFSSHELVCDTEKEQTLRRETYIAASNYLPFRKDNLSDDETDGKSEFEDSLSPVLKHEAPKSDFSMLLDNIKFTPGAKTSGKLTDIGFTPHICSTTNKYVKNKLPVSPLSPEHTANTTFNIASNHCIANNSNSESSDTYELSTSPKCSKSFKKLKPVRLSCTFEHTDQSLLSKSVRQFDNSSVKDVLQADLWAKATSSSPISKPSQALLHSINEQNPDETDENKVFEISPPKKFTRDKYFPRKKSPLKSGRIVKEKLTLEPSSLKKKIQQNKPIKSPNGSMTISGMKVTKLSRVVNSYEDKDSKLCQKDVRYKKVNDPHAYLNIFCNPDPFAATMTHDPFLTSSVYFDDQWVLVQELEFKKWLNELLTPPEHLTADVDTVLVDIGKVWQSCRMKEDVVLAETKESISARYHTNTRLNSLRKAACAMFRNAEVTDALSRTTVGIEKGILLIREDRDLNRDIGLQKTVLELFLSYNPLWLRIGLETVYGEAIPLQSNNDLIGLTRFLLGRFFCDPFLAKTHSHQSHANIKLPSFMPLMNKFMLKKFLFVVFFLDYAKKKKLISHDPCLFHKRARTKDSRSILLTFSREILKGIGDVTKVLRNYGYVVSHKQTYLEEYDYALVSIATDLRDGVRLCKIMELITGKKDLTCKCRVPAISRLQKIHNVDVALKALRDAGYSIKGDIDAKSIADGHREKTLSLLWQIIHKFQAPRFEKAACTVQRWWRAKLWYIRVRNLVRTIKYEAASTIQRSWKSYLARRELQTLREERLREMQRQDQAALKIQSYWRLWKESRRQHRRLGELGTAAGKIQRWWRRIRDTRSDVLSYQEKRKAARTLQMHWRARQLMMRARARYNAVRSVAIKLQGIRRARLLSRCVFAEYQRMKSAAIFIQRQRRATLLMREQRHSYLKQLDAVRKVQTWWKNVLLAKRERSSYLRAKKSAITIEAWWIAQKQANKAREEYLTLRSKAMVIQRAYRRYRDTEGDVARYKSQKAACLRIQTWWRSTAASRRFQALKRNCVAVQRRRRRLLQARSERAAFLAMKRSAMVIENHRRTQICRREYRRKRMAAVAIQTWYRRTVAAKATRAMYLETKSAVKSVEAWWCNLQVGKVVRSAYTGQRTAVVVIQQRWRAWLAMKESRAAYLETKVAVVRLQSWYRMVREKRRYRRLLAMKSAAIVLQRKWRALKRGREARASYAKATAAIVTIQRFWRAISSGRAQRKRYLEMKGAAITIQKYRRTVVALRKFEREKWAARTVQSWWSNFVLARRVSKEFLQLKTATIRVQRRWRMRRQMADYRLTRSAIIKIQLSWRSTLVTRRIRDEFTKKREAAIVLQRRYRAMVAGAEARTIYRKHLAAIRRIQRWWRRALADERLRLLNEKRVAAVCVIEDWWLRILTSRREAQRRLIAEQMELDRISSQATRIQAVWRGYRVRRSASKRLRELRLRSQKATEAAVHSATLAVRLQESINVFLYANNIGQLAMCLSSLDIITRMSPNACINVCQLNLVMKLYDILTRSNRSLPWLDICLKVISILVTLAKFKETTEYVLKEEYIEVLARLLHVAVDNKVDLFLHVATLLWILTENADYAQAVVSCSRSKWLLTTLRATISKKAARTTVGPCGTSYRKGKVDSLLELPSPKPDWGLRHKRPRIFTSPSQAIDSILTRLNLSVFHSNSEN